MYTHSPNDYVCPLCLANSGIESADTMMEQGDIFYRDELVIAAINSKFVGNNPGHVVIFTRNHYENVYDLPEQEATQVMKVAKAVAIALKKTRNCDGVMIQQNNEPASGQHAFHYHLNVFPRFDNDYFWENQANVTVALSKDKRPFSSAMKQYFSKLKI